MRRVVLDLPDNISDMLTFTAIGSAQMGQLLDSRASIKGMNLHRTNYMRLNEDGGIDEESFKDYSAMEDDLK